MGQPQEIESGALCVIGRISLPCPSISEMESATDDASFFKGLQGFRASKKYLGDLTGTTIRQSLSKRVLGSGTYMGQGIVFGKSEAEGTRLASESSAARSEMRPLIKLS